MVAPALLAAGISAAGALGGGAMSGKGGGGGSVNTTQQQNVNMGPWSEQGPYLEQGFAQAGGILNNWDPNPHYYPGSTVSPFNVGQTNAQQAIVNRASNDPMMPAAQQSYLDTVGGKFLDPSTNPWLAKTFGAASDDVTRAYQTAVAPQTDANMSMAGRYGSGSHALMREGNERALGSTLNNLATDIYGGNYQAERGRQYDAMGNVGNMIQAGFLNPTAIMNVGNMQQQQAQRELGDDVARWNIESNPYTKTQAQWDQLKNYMGIVGSGNWGQTGTTTGMQQQPYFSNPAAGAVGGALGGLSLAGQLGWSPFGGGSGFSTGNSYPNVGALLSSLGYS